MKSFDVLNPETNIRQNYFLEASAGTGKTFSIENIVVRLLAEQNPVPLDKILVVTFTQAATRELKMRIQEKIKFNFSDAQIYTIHGFCSKMLQNFVFEGDLSIQEIEPIAKTEILCVIRDFFRTELVKENYSKQQIKSVLKLHGQDIEALQNQLFTLITQGTEFEKTPNFSEAHELFQHRMKRFNLSSQRITEDFMRCAPHFKGLCNRQREIKPEVLEKLHKFAALFDQNEWTADDFNTLIEDQLFIVKALDPSKMGAKPVSVPEYFSEIEKELLPLVSPHVVLVRMAHDCQQLLQRRLIEEEKLTFDWLLKAMLKALDNPEFVQKVSNSYQVAIIDEFQDTDPIQWEIFRKLFISGKWKGNLYLVGDPKQSIYAFRQADIYSYLAASEAFKKEHHASLDTNYRSQPKLVEALNILFDSDELFPLPRLNKYLPYRPVKASDGIPDKTFSDEWGAVHFFIAEEMECFFSFMAQEIQRLNRKDQIQFKQMAILVADRFQADRVAAFFDEWMIPAAKQRTSSLADSPALPALRELLKAVITPRHESSLRTALGGPIIGWTHDQVKMLDDESLYEKTLFQFFEWRLLLNQGIAPFYQKLMQSVMERVLSQHHGIDFYNDLQQIVEILMEYQSTTHTSPEGLLLFLDQFKILDINEDDRIKKRRDPNQDAVNILTLHSSKGLEYDVVFAFGLIKRSKPPGHIVSGYPSAFVDKKSPEYIQHCKEVDAEKMRQLYVAMTRAKYRLYCPVARYPKPAELGCASSMELFLSKIGKIPEHATITCSDLDTTSFQLSKEQEQCSVKLTPPKKVTVPGKAQFISSFTQLAKQQSSPESKEGTPHDFHTEQKNVHTLPAGSDTGVLLHRILEMMPFKNLRVTIQSYIKGTPYTEWEETIVRIITNALHTPIIDDFCIADLNPNQCYKEIEFLYPTGDLMKGIIDLVFQHEGKFYILDWKSNWLGKDIEDYRVEKLENVMREHQYFLQANIYSEALKRYLKIMDKEQFGGVYYVFLRGLSPTHGSKYGIYKS